VVEKSIPGGEIEDNAAANCPLGVGIFQKSTIKFV
jgi:hypothetical protein